MIIFRKGNFRITLSIVLAIFTLFTVLSCNRSERRTSQEITYIMNTGSATPRQMAELEKVLAKRLAVALGPDQEFTINRLGQGIEIVVKDYSDMPDMSLLLESQGQIRIYETYENLEFFPLLEAINEKLAQGTVQKNPATEASATEVSLDIAGTKPKVFHDSPRPILQYLRPSTITDGEGAIKLKTGPVIGYVNIPDTTSLLQFLAFDKEQSLLPDNVKLVLSWSPITTAESAFEILAIKEDSFRTSSIAISRALVKDVVINERKNKPVELQILFTEEGQHQMDVLARHNSGKNIAVLLDGRVISYPVIKQKEGNSSLSLTDHWDKAEAAALAALFRSEPLPVPLRVLSVKNEELQD